MGVVAEIFARASRATTKKKKKPIGNPGYAPAKVHVNAQESWENELQDVYDEPRAVIVVDATILLCKHLGKRHR